MHLQLISQKRVGDVFVVKFFTKNKAKLNHGVSKDDQNHKLGDAPCIPLHQQTSQFANLQKRNYYYASFIKFGASSFLFNFLN
jgi:hypothetical protein